MLRFFDIMGIPILALGAFLLIRGWIGRPIDGARLCRACGYDVSGTGLKAERCPECGRLLTGPSAVRIGRRRRDRTMIVSGITMILVGLGGAGATQFFGGTPESKPEWWLTMELASTSGATRDAAAEELRRRVGNDSISSGGLWTIAEFTLDEFAQIGQPHDNAWIPVLEAALEDPDHHQRVRDRLRTVFTTISGLQQDVNASWSTVHGVRVDLIHLLDCVSDEEYFKFLLAGERFACRLVLPERVFAGRPIRGKVIRDLSRVRRSDETTIFRLVQHGAWFEAGDPIQVVAIRSIRVNGVEIPTPEHAIGWHFSPYLFEEAVEWTLLPLDESAEVTIAVDVERAIWSMDDVGDGMSPVEVTLVDGLMPVAEDKILQRWDDSFEATIEVVADDLSLVQLQDRPDVVSAIDHEFYFKTVVYESGEPGVVEGMLVVEIPAASYCYRIFALSGDREQEVGALFGRRAVGSIAEPIMLQWSEDSWLMDTSEVTLEFRADRQRALEGGMSDIVGNTIRLQGVQLERQRPVPDDPAAELEGVLAAMAIAPHSAVISPGLTTLEVTVSVDAPIEGWGFQGALEIGGTEYEAGRVRLFRSAYRRAHNREAITRTLTASIPRAMPAEELRSVMLLLRPMDHIGLDHVVRLGPFDFTPLLD